MPILLVKNKLPQQKAESSAKKTGEIDQKPAAVTDATYHKSTKPELACGGDNEQEQTKKSKKQRKSRFTSAYYSTTLILPANQPWNVRVAPVAKFRSPTVALGLACVHVTNDTNLANPFKLNDVILKINGAILSNTPVTSAKGMLKKERSKSKGKECRLEILRLKESHRDDPTVSKNIPVKLIPPKLDLKFKSNSISSSLGEDHTPTIDEHMDHNGDDVESAMPKDTTLTQNKEVHNEKGQPRKMVDAACQTEPITMTSSCTQTLSPTKPTYASTYVQTETETARNEKETEDRNAHPQISHKHNRNHEDSHGPQRKRSRLMTTDTTNLKTSSSQRRHADNEPESVMQEKKGDSLTVSQHERSSVALAATLAATLITNTSKEKDNISESISNSTLSKDVSSLPFDLATTTTSTNSTAIPTELKKDQEKEKNIKLDMLTKLKPNQSADEDVGDEYSESNSSNSSSSSRKSYTEEKEEEVDDLNIRRTTNRKRKFMAMARAVEKKEEEESRKSEPTDAHLKRSAQRSKNNVITGLAEDKVKIPLHEESESSKPKLLSHRELVTERDRKHVGEYLLLLMKQFLKYDASSHKNKRSSKTSASGSFFDNRALMARMVCRHCENSFRPYCFTPTSRSLGSRFKSNHAHFLKCRRCPKKVRDDLERLEKAQTQQWVKCRQNAESKFYERVWARLNSFDPAECFEATSDEESDSDSE